LPLFRGQKTRNSTLPWRTWASRTFQPAQRWLGATLWFRATGRNRTGARHTDIPQTEIDRSARDV